MSGPRRRLADDARAALLAYDWPGNVRELHNRIQRATLVAAGDVLGADDFGLDEGGHRDAAPLGPEEEEERRRIELLLVETDGMVSRAAQRLGVSRQALYRRMERLGIVIERRPRV